jgi:hypothetical protein
LVWRILCEKIRWTAVRVAVKGAYLIELAANRYRIDTNAARIARFARFARQVAASSVRSSA